MRRICSLLLSLTLAFLSFVLVGCAKEPFPEIVAEHPPLVLPEPVTPIDNGGVIGTTVRGRAISTIVQGTGDDVSLIMATIHGNEPAGTPLVNRLSAYLRAHPELLKGRKVVMIPIANPDGFAADTRYNAHGVDINRNFEAANRISNATNGMVGLSEPESRAIKSAILKYRPNRIVTIHQPLDCIDYDGPAGPLATQMGRYCNLPVKKIGARPGSLGSYAGLTLGIPIITMELPDGMPDADTLWNLYGKALLAAVLYPTAPN